MIHKTEIEGFNLQELADKVGDLRYDTLQDFLLKLSIKIKKDGTKDRSRGRIKLANELDEASNKLQECSININKAWVICEPYV